jgi:hypothetical protein
MGEDSDDGEYPVSLCNLFVGYRHALAIYTLATLMHPRRTPVNA